MTESSHIARRFGDHERERLIKLLRSLGSDNAHEAEAARGRIDSLLRSFDKTWSDLSALLGTPAAFSLEVVADIVALGSGDLDQRTKARANIAELLARHRKTWNDLIDELCSLTPAAWVNSSPSSDPTRVNPLDLVHHLIGEYVELRAAERLAVALWSLHSFVYGRFTVTPRLVLRSPVAGCGKTVLLDLLTKLTAQAAKFDAVTASAIYHMIDASHPTLLIDEADNLALGLQPNGRLRAIFNSGHHKGGKVVIMTRDGPQGYETFAPMALALPDASGGLPRTLNSRSITIMMRRSAGAAMLRRLDLANPDPALDLPYEQILLWRREVELDPDPELPAGVHNRIADNWRPLLSIADSLGRGKEAREAMMTFVAEYQDADVKIVLLSDIRRVFDFHGTDRMPSKVLVEALHNLNDSDWQEFTGIRGDQAPHRLRETELAAMLRDFMIKPRSIWPLRRTAESKSSKGYTRSQFEESWRMYCDAGTAAHNSNVKGLRSA